MTPERQDEKKLKKSERVVMHTCIESEAHGGRIWTCSGDQFTRGTGALAQDSVFLEGFSGSFAPEYLQKVILPSEDERVLAALEEAQQQLKETEDWEEDAYAWRDFCDERNNLDPSEFTEDNFVMMRQKLQDHGPSGRNYTNEQYVTLQGELAEAQQTIETLRIAKDYEIELHAQSCIEYQQTIARLTAALITERDDALTWDGIGTVNRINKALGETQP